MDVEKRRKEIGNAMELINENYQKARGELYKQELSLLHLEDLPEEKREILIEHWEDRPVDKILEEYKSGVENITPEDALEE